MRLVHNSGAVVHGCIFRFVAYVPYSCTSCGAIDTYTRGEFNLCQIAACVTRCKIAEHTVAAKPITEQYSE